METTNKEPVRKKGRGWRIFFTILLVFCLAVGGVAWYGWTWFQSKLAPVGDSGRPVVITIPKGASSTGVGKILLEAGLIHNSTVFRLWLRHKELDGKIQAGDYILNDSLSLNEIVSMLVKGEVHRDTIRFTIPEGLFLEDIAARLAAKGIVDKDKFMEVAGNIELWQDRWFLQDLPPDLDVPLEGYLFPETYEIFANAENKEELIIATMLHQFDKVFSAEMKAEIQAQGKSIHEIVTMASIVEKEAVVNKERNVIAGVFYNRLRQPMALQSCATVNYIIKDFSIRDITPYKENPSKYNTYKYRGLPPGPIASPGRASLEAAVWPEENQYLYFVAKDDGSGEHYFAKTYNQHIKNAKKAKENRNK